MHNLKIKICGIINRDDALAAVDAGADAIGLMFYESSPKHLTFQAAQAIVQALPPSVMKVGVFVNPAGDWVRQAITECGLDTLQFHGDESPEFCRSFAPLIVFKAFRIQNVGSLRSLPAYQTDAWLLDSCVPGKPGGTGMKFNWDLACAAKKLGRPIILAGGLTPENVAEAVRQVQPCGVDVSSGVEAGPGKKDHRMIQEFIAAARSA